MSDAAVAAVVQALQQARASGRPARVSDVREPLTTDEQAYAVQAQVARLLRWFDDGAPRYWKSGGASRDSALTHAALPPAGVWQSPASAAPWPFALRYVEAEVALRLGQPVNAGDAASLDRDSARRLVDAMAVSIEIVDSRWDTGLQAPDLLRLADLQSHGALVLGDWVPYAPRDWTRQACLVRIAGQVAAERQGSHALGDPTWLLADWLRHATRDGQGVPAGAVVTTGSWVVLEARAGDLVEVEFDGIGRASVQL